MSDQVTSYIRTWTPMIAGAVVAWLAGLGIELDDQASLALGSVLTALFGGLYYWIVRKLEKKWAQFGWLLGRAKKPEYK